MRCGKPYSHGRCTQHSKRAVPRAFKKCGLGWVRICGPAAVPLAPTQTPLFPWPQGGAIRSPGRKGTPMGATKGSLVWCGFICDGMRTPHKQDLGAGITWNLDSGRGSPPSPPPSLHPPDPLPPPPNVYAAERNETGDLFGPYLAHKLRTHRPLPPSPALKVITAPGAGLQPRTQGAHPPVSTANDPHDTGIHCTRRRCRQSVVRVCVCLRVCVCVCVFVCVQGILGLVG